MDTVTPLLEEAADSMSAKVVDEIGAILGRRHMYRSDLARALGKSPVWVSERMTGKTRISVDDMALIAAALKVRMVDLLPREQRDGVTPWERHARRDAMSLAPAPAPSGPYSGVRGPLPDKMSLGPIGRAPAVLKTDTRPTLVRPRGV